MESPETDPHKYGQLMFDQKNAKQWSKDNLSNKWCDNWTSLCKKKEEICTQTLNPI